MALRPEGGQLPLPPLILAALLVFAEFDAAALAPALLSESCAVTKMLKPST